MWSGNHDLIPVRDRLVFSPLFLRIYGPTPDKQISLDGSILGIDQGEVVEQIKTKIYSGLSKERSVVYVHKVFIR